jgi:hypothetical protein
MKTIFFFVLIYISVIYYSCQKDKTAFIKHDSEIFSNDDTLIVGKWDYLFTWSGEGFTGSTTKSFNNLPTISISSKGYYELIRDNKTYLTGIIDTIGFVYKTIKVMFYPNCVKSQNIVPQTLHIQNRDTLIIGLAITGDYFSSDYYKRTD